MPDFDGRPEPAPDGGDALLWIPRVLTAPLYLLSEYVIRRPLAWIVTELERIDAFTFLYDLFTFGDNREVGVFPTAFYDFGLAPSVGIYGYWRDLLVSGNRLSLHAATFGQDWLSLVATDRYAPRDDLSVALRVEAVQRPDQIFGGIGWRATNVDRTRYGRSTFDIAGSLRQDPWRRSRLEYTVGYRSSSFRDAGWNGESSISQRDSSLPVGFSSGYSALRFGASLLLDTRPVDELTRGGLRVRVDVTQNVAFAGITEDRAASTARWLRWGGELHLSTDVLGRGRVISLSGQVAFISPIEGAPVPFTELIDVGGTGPLFAFLPGVLLGQSMAVAKLEYVWPVWTFLDATLHLATGNAFGENLSDFSPDRMRLSFGVGVLPRFGGEHLFELSFAVGTESFERGAEVTSIRFVFGARNGL